MLSVVIFTFALADAQVLTAEGPSLAFWRQEQEARDRRHSRIVLLKVTMGLIGQKRVIQSS